MSVERARTSSPEGIPSPFGDSKQKVSVERLELSTNGLKGQLAKNAVDNQGITVYVNPLVGWIRKSLGCGY
jgi:hypothetical protein